MNLKIKKILDFWLGGFLVVLLYFPVRIAGQFLRRSHDLSSPQHIALVKLLGGGSLFMAYPLIQALKKKIPGLKISVVCSKQVAPFAQVMDVFDEIRVLDDRHFGTLLRSSIDHILWLARNVDITVDLEIYSRLTTIFTTVSLVKNRIGLINTQSFWRRRIYSHAIFVNSQHGIFYYYDGIANLFGIKSINIIEAQDHFLEHIQKTKNAQQELQDVKYFTFGVGCSDLAFERMLPEKNWISLGQQILQQQLTEKIVFIGGKADAILAERMIAELPAGRGLNLCGQLDLMGSLAVLLKSQCFLGIDSALIHFARFLRKNVVGFWGPTSPESLLRPLAIKEFHVYQKLDCSPCVHFTERPPCLGQNVCMNHQGSEQQVLDFLSGSRFSGAQGFASGIDSMNESPIESKSFLWIFHPSERRPQRHEIKSKS